MLTFCEALEDMPVLAVLRGISADEAVSVGEALVRQGICILEVPLNSPQPLRSIRLLADWLGNEAVIAAGTVLSADDVAGIADSGGRIVVSPNFDGTVVQATKGAGLVSVPGVFTPTEAFAALEAGADALKLFPGDVLVPKAVGALRAVLPPETRLVVTGGVGVENVDAWLDAGADGVGIGSALYKPKRAIADLEDYAARLVQAVARWRERRR